MIAQLCAADRLPEDVPVPLEVLGSFREGVAPFDRAHTVSNSAKAGLQLSTHVAPASKELEKVNYGDPCRGCCRTETDHKTIAFYEALEKAFLKWVQSQCFIKNMATGSDVDIIMAVEFYDNKDEAAKDVKFYTVGSSQGGVARARKQVNMAALFMESGSANQGLHGVGMAMSPN